MKERAFKEKKGAKIYEPDFSIKEKIGDEIANIITPDKVEKAKSYIEEKKKTFGDEAKKDVKDMMSEFIKFKRDIIVNYTKAKESEHYVPLCNKVLNLKSNAGIYGYPLATYVAKSFFEYMEKISNITLKALDIMNAHLSTIYIIFEKEIRDDGGALGKMVLDELKEATKEM